MVEAVYVTFSVALVFQLVVAYFIIYTSIRASDTFSWSLQYLLAATVFIASAVSVRLAFYNGFIDATTMSVIESYFYTISFLVIVIPSLKWHEIGTGPKARKLSTNIAEFYGEETHTVRGGPE